MTNIVDIAFGYAACAHRHQKRKYTDLPYVTHCMAVKNILERFVTDPTVLAAALLHDVIEDTDASYDDIVDIFGEDVADLVLEVTDASKPEDGNRKVRKKIDRMHLAKSSPSGASIKLADLIHNTSSIVEHDEDFAKIYIHEKAELLPLLAHGDQHLFRKAWDILNAAQRKLGMQVTGYGKGITREY